MPANQSTPEVTRALKPCPFCGGEAERFTAAIGKGFENRQVQCRQCGASAFDQKWQFRTPARGGDELRETQQHIEVLRYLDTQYLPGGPRDLKGALRAGIAALASTDMAGALPMDESSITDEMVEDAIAHGFGERFANRPVPPVEGLTSGEGLAEAAKAVLVNADRPGARMCFGGGPNGDDIWIDHKEVDQSVLDTLAEALAASPKATATANDQISRENDQ